MRWILKRVLANHALLDERTISAYLLPYRDDGKAIMTFTKATELLCDRRLPGVFSDLGTRVTLLWCRCDKMVPESSIRELRRIIPGNCYFEHPWGGHHLMEDDPEWVVDRIVECFAVSKSV